MASTILRNLLSMHYSFLTQPIVNRGVHGWRMELGKYFIHELHMDMGLVIFFQEDSIIQ